MCRTEMRTSSAWCPTLRQSARLSVHIDMHMDHGFYRMGECIRTSRDSRCVAFSMKFPAASHAADQLLVLERAIANAWHTVG